MLKFRANRRRGLVMLLFSPAIELGYSSRSQRLDSHLDTGSACRPWPSLSDIGLPNTYRVFGAEAFMEDAKRELKEWFRISDVSTSEGVYLRWCLQACLEKFSVQSAEIKAGLLRSRQQIDPVREAVLMWLQKLYVPDLYQTSIPETYLHGALAGERLADYLDMLDRIMIQRGWDLAL